MKNAARIQLASRRLRYILTGVTILIPISMALIWVLFNDFPAEARGRMIPYDIYGALLQPLPLSTRLLAFVVSMIPAGVMIWGLFILMRLFRLYEQGEIFRMSNVRCFRQLSRVLIWFFFAGIATQPLLSLALTIQNPAGQRMLTFGLESGDLTALLLGGILAVISWVMEEGCQLQEDQDLTV